MRGARFLILLSRSGVQSEASTALVEELKSIGVHSSTPACDITDIESLSPVLTECAKAFPPIKGTIQASMVLKVRLLQEQQSRCMLINLKDAVIENIIHQDWELSLTPKIRGSWNLHTLLPKGLDFFICLSSISGIIGNGGQANYTAENTYMDALVQYRVALGEKATSLDLGWMESEGVVAESAALATSIAVAGHFISITQAEFHALLDHYCNPARHPGSSNSCQAIVGPEIPAVMLQRGMKEPHWMQRRTFRHLRQMELGRQLPLPQGKSWTMLPC